jgi:hypothetical protein
MFFLIWVAVGAIFAWAGASMAANRNRDPMLWGIISFFTGIIGIVILAVIGEERQPVTAQSYSASTLPMGRLGDASVERAVTNDASVKSYDVKRWTALKEVDGELAVAAKEASELGPGHEDELAEKFLILNDKNYLPNLIDNLRKKVAEKADFEARQQETAANQAALKAEAAKRAAEEEVVKGREFQDAFLKRIAENGGRDPENNKVVKLATPCSGKYISTRGGVRVVYADGSAVIRRHSSSMSFANDQEAIDWGG